MNRYDLQQHMEAHPEAKLKDLVMEMLFQDIISLNLAPGSRINVNQIAASMGISRTPVVEAVTALTEAGFLVNHQDSAGSYVLELSLKDMISLYQVRDAIESEASYLCAHNADDSAIVELTRLAEAFRDSVFLHDIRGMKDTDMPFHRLIVETCGNPYLIRSYQQILPYLTRYQASMLEFIRRSSNDQNPWFSSVQYNHIAVVSAIRLRLPELARQSMTEHIASSLNFTSLSGVDPFATAK